MKKIMPHIKILKRDINLKYGLYPFLYLMIIVFTSCESPGIKRNQIDNSSKVVSPSIESLKVLISEENKIKEKTNVSLILDLGLANNDSKKPCYFVTGPFQQDDTKISTILEAKFSGDSSISDRTFKINIEPFHKLNKYAIRYIAKSEDTATTSYIKINNEIVAEISNTSNEKYSYFKDIPIYEKETTVEIEFKNKYSNKDNFEIQILNNDPRLFYCRGNPTPVTDEMQRDFIELSKEFDLKNMEKGYKSIFVYYDTGTNRLYKEFTHYCDAELRSENLDYLLRFKPFIEGEGYIFQPQSPLLNKLPYLINLFQKRTKDSYIALSFTSIYEAYLFAVKENYYDEFPNGEEPPYINVCSSDYNSIVFVEPTAEELINAMPNQF